MRHYFNLDGTRVVPNAGCDDGVFSGEYMGGARIFAEARVPDAGCGNGNTSGGTSNPYGEGEASCQGGYYCSTPNAYNAGVLYDVEVEGGNTCIDNSICEFITQDEDGDIDVVTGANPIYGCTDPNALNYDPNADYNSGCQYPTEDVEDPFDAEPDPQIQGCTNPNALNYDPNATIGSDDLCMFEEVEPVGLNNTTIFVAGGAAILLLLALRKR